MTDPIDTPPYSPITGQTPSPQTDYKYGFSTQIETEAFSKGLTQETIRQLSAKKEEPPFILEFRLKAFEKWKQMKEPHWLNGKYPSIDYQNITYYSAPKKKQQLSSLDEVDPNLLATFEKLGIPLDEQKRLTNVAVDVVFDSISIGTTFKKQLAEAGVVLCSMSEAIHLYPELIQKYLGSVVPAGDNFYAALNSAVFSDGSFVYVPKGIRCPIELATYFRINDKESGQFERTLIVVEEDSYVSYLEGCTAPSYDNNQLHAAVVELVVLERGEIKYSTVQNWYPGNPKTGAGGVYNFVTKRGMCQGNDSKISWIQVEAGAAITWKYPSCILKGDRSIGEFYSVALTNGYMQADTGTKMIHIGTDTRSRIVSKGISSDHSSNTYRGIVKMAPKARNSRNHTQCDSMLVGNKCSANTFPVIETANASSRNEHEASTSKISRDQVHYLECRGLSKEDAIALVLNGFCREVINQLPLEFAVEANKLLTMKLANSVG